MCYLFMSCQQNITIVCILQEKFSELTEYIDEARHQWQNAEMFAPTSLVHARQLLVQAQVIVD